jgi:hypothetical protein
VGALLPQDGRLSHLNAENREAGLLPRMGRIVEVAQYPREWLILEALTVAHPVGTSSAGTGIPS